MTTIATPFHRVRVLPPEEWDKIRHIPPYDRGVPTPEHWQPLVVEDADGAILGCCSIFDAVHWDCWWVDPTHPAKAGVFWSLISAGLQDLRDLGIGIAHVVIPEDRPDLAALVERFGFEKAKGALYFCDPARHGPVN
jgi:hypothetical protein